MRQSRGVAEGDRAGMDDVRLQAEQHIVGASESPQQRRVGQDVGLRLVNHDATGHIRPEQEYDLWTEGELGAGPAVLHEAGALGVQHDVDPQPPEIQHQQLAFDLDDGVDAVEVLSVLGRVVSEALLRRWDGGPGTIAW